MNDQHVAYEEHTLSTDEDAVHSTTTVLICQNTLLRTGLRSILADSGFEVTQHATQDLSAFGKKTSLLCLICADRAADGVVESIERVKSDHPNARVVILADDIVPADLLRSYQAGLDGLCSTAMSRDALVRALELVMLGERFVSAKLCFSALLEASSRQPTDFQAPAAPANTISLASTPNGLSGREVQILRSLTRGGSNKHIARELGLAEATVKVHIKAILRKVRLTNRTQAAIWAKQHLKPAAADEAELPSMG